MPELNEKLLNRLGIAEAMAHRAKATAGRLQQAAAKHHDAQNADIDALGKQIEAAGIGQDEDAENRYCRALVARGHMAQAHHLAGLDAARMPEVGASLEKGRINRAQIEAAGQGAMDFEEQAHPRAAEGTSGKYKPGEFVPKGEQQGAAEKPAHEKDAWEIPLSNMKPISHYNKQEWDQYADENGKIVDSSRTTPQRLADIPLGTWRYSDWKGPRGREVEQLREVDPKDLIPGEETEPSKHADVDRYAGWAKEGKIPPPIEVVETDDGKLKVVNGHRRWLAAKRIGTPRLHAWVSPSSVIPDMLDSEGRPMKTGLTHELAIHHAIEAGHRVPDEVLQDYPELKSKHDQKRKEALRDAAQSAQEDGHPGLAEAHEDGLTATPAFKKWFGDSQVVDSAGKPLEVYHGTDREFDAFDPKKIGENTKNPTAGLGFFFTESHVVARTFSGEKLRSEPAKDVRALAQEHHGQDYHSIQDQEVRAKLRQMEKEQPKVVRSEGEKPAGAKVLPAYLSIQNPYPMTMGEWSEKFMQPLMQKGGADKVRETVAETRKRLEADGYDGIILEKFAFEGEERPTNEYSARSFIAFRPEQIKSTENEGTFDPSNADMKKAVRRTFHSPGQAAMEFDEEQHPREAKGATTGRYKPGEFVPKDTPEKAPWQQSRADYLAARPLPKEDYGWPQAGEFPFVVTDNGAVYVDKNPGNNTHIRFADKLGIPAERIVSGGFLRDGELDDMGARSDAARYGEQARAKRRFEHRVAVANAVAEGKDVPRSVLQDYPDLAEKGRPETLDPKEDWKKNGVRSKSFKSWFGDWENDPKNASKVVDTETSEPAETWETRSGGKTQARPVFHGSGKGGFSAFDPSRTDPDGLFGPGFYFTEDQEIAESYLKKELPELGLDRDLTDADMGALRKWATKYRQINLAAIMAAKMDTMPRDRFQNWVADRPSLRPALRAIGVDIKAQGKPTLYPCYLNVREPFDIDSRPDDAARERIGSALRSFGIDPGTRLAARGQEDGQDLFHAVCDLCLDAQTADNPKAGGWRSSKEGAVAVLKQAGFDGITHIGGTYVGTGETKHRVWIAWEPTQIKHTENEGTFDPKDPNINKAVRRPFVPPDMPRWRGPRPSSNSYLPLNGVEDREKFLAMAKEMAAGTWTWDKPLIRCGDQLLSGSHRYAAAQTAGVPVETMDADDLFKEGGLDFRETWTLHAQPYTSWLNNMDAALKRLPPQLLAKYGVDLG